MKVQKCEPSISIHLVLNVESADGSGHLGPLMLTFPPTRRIIDALVFERLTLDHYTFCNKKTVDHDRCDTGHSRSSDCVNADESRYGWCGEEKFYRDM